MRLSWLVGGDFNVIMSEEENIDGITIYPNEYKDFFVSICVNYLTSTSKVVLLPSGMKGLIIYASLSNLIDWLRINDFLFLLEMLD